MFNRETILALETNSITRHDYYQVRGIEGEKEWEIRIKGRQMNVFHVGDIPAIKGIRQKDFLHNEVAYLDKEGKVHTTDKVKHIFIRIPKPKDELYNSNDDSLLLSTPEGFKPITKVPLEERRQWSLYRKLH